MIDLLIFFALPLATIILATVLERVLHSPTAVAATFFAIYLVIPFIIGNLNYLIATIAYTILAYIAAAAVKFIFNMREDMGNNQQGCVCINNNENNFANNQTNTFQDNNIVADTITANRINARIVDCATNNCETANCDRVNTPCLNGTRITNNCGCRR